MATFCFMPRESSPGSACSLPVELEARREGLGARLEVRHAVDARRSAQVLDDGQVLEQLRLVGHERELPLGLDRLGGDVVAADGDVAVARCVDAGEAAQRGGLARAVRPDQADDLAAARQ